MLLRQPAQGYRVAIDPVLLAAAVSPQPGQAILDAGCGVGAAALCLAVRRPGFTIVGIERDPETSALGRRNVDDNALTDRIEIAEAEFEAFVRGNGGRFDQVITNPPFLARARHTQSPFAGKAAAHGETDLGLADWIVAAAGALRSGGALTMIHRADRMDEIFAALAGKFGAILIYPLWPRIGAEARRILVSAIKGRKTPPRLLPGMVLHEADGAFTQPALAVLRDGQALVLDR